MTTGTSGSDLFFFDGETGLLTVTLVNPYTGESVNVNDIKNINRGVYDGLGGIDTILMTNIGDAIFIRDSFGTQAVTSIETFLAGDGGDVIALADASFILNNLVIFGGEGGDILWANIGNDFISGAGGDDMINGGPGNDQLEGEDDNDTIYGGTGDDALNGGNGHDVLIGGTGADNYIAGDGNDAVTEGADGNHDIITLPSGITLANLTFSDPGNDLIITVGALGTITIGGQFDSATSGIDELVFSNGTHFNLRTLYHNYAPVAQNDDFNNNEDNVLTGNVLLNNGHGVDSDQNGDTLSVTPGVFTTAHGTVNLLADGSFTYTPALNYFGSDSFTYTVLDGHGLSDTATVNISIASVNDAPVAGDDSAAGNEDTVISGSLLGNDSDIDGGTLSVTAGIFATAHGSVNILADGSFTYTAGLNYFGSDSFYYTLLDGQGGSDIGTVTLTINSVNDAPVALDDSAAGNEDTVIAGNVLGNDSDIDGGVLSVLAATIATAHGTVELLANGDFTYTPDLNYFGTDSFDYTLEDGQGGTDISTVNLMIDSVNDAPVAADDDLSTNEDIAFNSNVLADNGHNIDSDIDGGILSVVAATLTTIHGGTVELLANGDFTYTPALNYFGSDSFDYTLLDGQGGSDVGTVNITIASVNDAPVAVDDNASGNEDTVIAGNIIGNNSDIDGGVLSVIAATFSTAHGTVELLENGDFTYTPSLNYFGADSFDYTLLDGQGGSDVGTVTLTITSVNDAPIAGDDSFTGNEDTVIAGNVLTNDSDVDGGILSVVAATLTTLHGGTVEILSNGDFTYTPALNFFGSDSFDYTLLDGQGGNDVATANIVVNSVNDDPVAVDDSASGNEDTVISDSVLGNDSDIDGGVLSVVAATFSTAHGTVNLLATGSFTYTPALNYFGTDSFNYTLLDGQGGTDIGTVNLTINSVNDGPVAVDDSASGNEDTVIAGNVLSNDSDIDGGILSVVAASFNTSHGTVSLLANGTFTYTPAANYFGADSFTYTLLDGQGGSDIGMVNILINDVNLIGTAGNDILNGTEHDDEISGLGGADHLKGNGGNDRLTYNADAVWPNGWVAWNVGSVSYDGTDAKFSIQNLNRSYDQFDGGGGIDTIVMTGDNDALFLDDAYSIRPAGTAGAHISGVEIIDAGAGHDVVDLTSKEYDYGDVTIYGRAGHDHLWASAGKDTIYGGDNNDDIFGGAGNDAVYGDDGHDVVYGGYGNDRVEGGDGNDTLYGGNNTALLTVNKQFIDTVLFPNVMETVNIHNLIPPGDPAVGIKHDNLDTGGSRAAVITRQASASGYDSTLGSFSIGEHGEILATRALWTNMNAVTVGATRMVDVTAGDALGFFIIANGNNTNGGYAGINILADNVLHFVYDYGQAGARAATINDQGSHISLVYDDGHTSRLLSGPMYFTTERGGSPDLNYDHRTHVISGKIAASNTDVLRVGFEDLPNLGDADYQDVVFDVNFQSYTTDVSETGNDVLIGGQGNDKLYGEGGNDILVVGEGKDDIYGGVGNDQIVYNVMDNNPDTIYGFETGAGHDVLNITDILEGFDSGDNINDFVMLVNSASGHTEVKIDTNGDGIGGFHTIAIFDTVLNETLAQLVAAGNIVANQHVTV